MISVGSNQAAPVLPQTPRPSSDPAPSSTAPATTKPDTPRPPAASWTFSDSHAVPSAAISAVSGSLQRAQSVLDATLAAGAVIGDLVSQARTSAAVAAGPDLDPATRQQYSERYDDVLKRIDAVVRSAGFDGASLIDKTAANFQMLSAPASADGTIAISVEVEDLSAGSGLGLTPDALATPAGAADQAARLDQAADRLKAGLGRFAEAAKAVESQLAAVTKLRNSLAVEPADGGMAKDSIGLQALQLKQQLAGGGLSIANSAPQTILSLFKGPEGG
ncbi:MAG: flagellin [Caulobacter sp.]|nr:flagellin [Caulobacter sp.]